MRKDDPLTAISARSEPSSPLRAKHCFGKKVILIADATDQQVDALISALFGQEGRGMTH